MNKEAGKTTPERGENFSTELLMALESTSKRKLHTTDHPDGAFDVPSKRSSLDIVSKLQHGADGPSDAPPKRPSSKRFKHVEDGVCSAPLNKPGSENPSRVKHQELYGSCNVPYQRSSKHLQHGKSCLIFAKLIDSGIVSNYERVFYLSKKDRSVMKEGAITRKGVLCRCCRQTFLLAKFETHAGSRLHRPSANMFVQDGRSLEQCQQALCETLDEDLLQENVKTSHSNHNAVETSNAYQDVAWISLNTGSPHCFSSEGLSSTQSHQDLRQVSSKVPLQDAPKMPLNATRMEEPLSACQVDSRASNAGLSPTFSSSESSCSSQLEDANGYTCEICGDGGELTLCAGCPSAFHASCLSLDEIPRGDWHCLRCRCGWCGLRLNSEESHKSCTNMMSCSQCNIPYHRSCIVESLQIEDIEGPWFCTKTCEQVFMVLQHLVGCEFPLDNGLSWMLLRSFREDMETKTKKNANSRTERLVFEAFRLLDQCFKPIVDSEIGFDVLAQIVFNRKSHIRRLDCRRFYTIILMKGDRLISAATIRTHGNVMAEMPLIGTSYEFRNQGMCKALIQGLEALLRDVEVNNLIIPSTYELVASWIRSFGFKHMSLKDRQELSSTAVLSFPGTTLLHRNIV